MSVQGLPLRSRAIRDVTDHNLHEECCSAAVLLLL
jgi:hypothetical protein